MGEDYLSVRPSWFTRLLRGVGLLPSGEVEFEAGADFAASQPARPGYPKGDALSAYAAFPWVHACVSALSSDLAGLPLVAVRGAGADAERLDSHPVLDLLAQPSTRVSAQLFRQQLLTDYILTGDAYALIAGEREPAALLRLIPQRVTVKPWADGQPGRYVYDSGSGEKSYDWEEVIHLRSPSWEDDPSNLFGTGAIRPLDADLRTELAALKSAEETAKTGRPSGIISPADDGDRWSKEQVARIRAGYSKQLSGQSGVLILGGSAKFDSLSMTPRDLEFAQQRQLTRESTLAVFSVPPTRVGLPSANYATAREQSRIYWSSLRSRASFLDDEMSRLARMFPNSESVRVEHDFSGVEALQESRDDRVKRVRSWYDMGLSLADAAAFEGFEDLPEQDIEAEEPEAVAVGDADEALRGLFAQVEKAAPADALPGELSAFASWFEQPDESSEEVRAPLPMPVTRAERVEVWRSYIDRLHGPAERRIKKAMTGFLRAQARRYASRLRKAQQKGITKGAPTDQELALVLAEEKELAALRQLALPFIASSIQQSYQTAIKQMGVGDRVFDPVRMDNEIAKALGSMVAEVQGVTKSAVIDILKKGYAEEVSISEIQRRLINSAAFDPKIMGQPERAYRALRIARTEATRTTNAGALAAFASAADEGIPVRKLWVTAGDDVVRDAHRELDGNFIMESELFNSEAGPIQGPGLSGDAGFDINCRCNLIPFIDKEDAEEFSAERQSQGET